MDFKDFVEGVKDCLDPDFRWVRIHLDGDAVLIHLYANSDIYIEYRGMGWDEIEVIGFATIEANGNKFGIDFETVREVYEVMNFIREHHEVLDDFIEE